MSTRRSTGVFLIATGWIGVFIGLVISVSLVGAICGVPLILVCIPIMIWGYLMKAKDQELKDEKFNERMLLTQATASGINICPQCKTPNKNTNPTCSGCGYRFVPTGNLQPLSVADPIEFAHSSKQVKNFTDNVIEDSSPDS